MPDLKARLAELEADVLYQELAGPGESEFKYEPGPAPVLISAPHGAVHTRHGANKEEDDFTSGLARLVAGLTGAHLLYTRRKSLTDPNWYPGVPYKARLAEIVARAGIRFVLDLHGAGHRHPFGVALGTLIGRSCPDQREALIRVLESAGFGATGQGLARLDVDHFFTAGSKLDQETVTRFAWESLGVPAAQLEIHECLRVASARPDASSQQLHLATEAALEQTVRALVAVVGAVQ